jgi:hypothetical protein
MEVLSSAEIARLRAFPKWKTAAFLLMIFDRAFVAIRTFGETQRLDYEEVEGARAALWQAVVTPTPERRNAELREIFLAFAPDSENFPSLEAMLALNACLMGVEIASYLESDHYKHVAEVFRYLVDLLDAAVFAETGEVAVTEKMESVADHALFQREREVERADLEYLATLAAELPSEVLVGAIRNRGERQRSMIS